MAAVTNASNRIMITSSKNIPENVLVSVDSCGSSAPPLERRKSSTTPEEKVINQPTAKDIIAERGTFSNNHGHDFYWTLIIENRDEFVKFGCGNNKENCLRKDKVALKVERAISSNGGRFLRRDKPTSPWTEMTLAARLKKIKEALRDVKNIPKSLRYFAKKHHKEVYNKFCKKQEEIRLKKEEKRLKKETQNRIVKKDSSKRSLKHKKAIPGKKAALLVRPLSPSCTIKSVPALKLNGKSSSGLLKDMSMKFTMPSGQHLQGTSQGCKDSPPSPSISHALLLPQDHEPSVQLDEARPPSPTLLQMEFDAIYLDDIDHLRNSINDMERELNDGTFTILDKEGMVEW